MLLPWSAVALRRSPSWKDKKNVKLSNMNRFTDWTHIRVTLSTDTRINPLTQAAGHKSRAASLPGPITYSLPQLPLFPLLHGGEVVDRRVLDHRQEDEDEADPEVDVHRLDVGDPGHGGVDPRDDGGHGQHGGDACGGGGTQSRRVTSLCRAPAEADAHLNRRFIFRRPWAGLSVSLRESADGRRLFERSAGTCCFVSCHRLLYSVMNKGNERGRHVNV